MHTLKKYEYKWEYLLSMVVGSSFFIRLWSFNVMSRVIYLFLVFKCVAISLDIELFKRIVNFETD